MKSYLRDRGKLDVHSMSELLNVSEVTVRRDLEKLESEGFLTRMHGGAILKDDEEPVPVHELGPEYAKEEADREEIARVAFLMVKDGDVLMLMNGPIALRLARKLSGRAGVTVLTNDIQVALELSGQAGNRAVLLGGSPDPESQALFGSLAQANVQAFFVNRLFVEVDGIGEQLQLTVSSQEKAALIKDALACAEDAIVLCEASRFARNAFFRLGPITLAKKIITNTSVSEAFKARIFAMDIQLFTSINAFEGGN
ncbi:MAG: DeoR/GlpR family DNA-binding transcription regulator [Spirochaetaceae bacterium]|nr:DeoR/GlpR family DNA-binding transcription regulator [Spirochaetaceae bacterium]